MSDLPIQRWGLHATSVSSRTVGFIEEQQSGEFVLYSDHVAAVDGMKQRAKDAIDAVRDEYRARLESQKQTYEFMLAQEDAAARQSLTTPPDGWFPFGSHVDWDGPLEMSVEVGEDGLPLWERHVQSLTGDTESRCESKIRVAIERAAYDVDVRCSLRAGHEGGHSYDY